jgi:hypothetical protein
VMGDKAYSSRANRSLLRARRSEAVIPELFDLVPLRMLAAIGVWPCSCPRCSVSSASNAVSSTFLVSWFSSPPGHQAHALLLGLREQPLRKFLLIDDLSRHRIDHHACHLGRGLRHGRLLSDQAGPHIPLFRQSQSILPLRDCLVAPAGWADFSVVERTEDGGVASLRSAISLASTAPSLHLFLRRPGRRMFGRFPLLRA